MDILNMLRFTECKTFAKATSMLSWQSVESNGARHAGETCVEETDELNRQLSRVKTDSACRKACERFPWDAAESSYAEGNLISASVEE